MRDYTPITPETATQKILASERGIAAMFRYFSPLDIVNEASLRFRSLGQNGAMGRTPPHCMIRAIEASCAYFNQASHQSLTGDYFEFLTQSLVGADDPVIEILMHQGGMSLLAYMHRSQLNMQREFWVVPMGRAEMLFGAPDALPQINAAFELRFGLTVRQWVQMTVLVHSATINRFGFPKAYIDHLGESQIPLAAAIAFLAHTSIQPSEIRDEYLRIRYGDGELPRVEPLAWYQKPSIISQHPLIRFGTNWVVPAPNLLHELVGNLLFERLSEVAVGPLRAELSERFVNYIVSVFRSKIPHCRIIMEDKLRGGKGEKVADIAIELPNAILLIEAKSVYFNRVHLTGKALLSGSSLEVVDGAIQIAETARRIESGRCPRAGVSADKPIYGLIATLGGFPHANDQKLFETGTEEFAKRELGGETLTPALSCRPFALGPDALEALALYLGATPDGLPALVQEKTASDVDRVGDWPLFLSRKTDGHQYDMSLWREAFYRLLTEFGVHMR